MNQTSFPFLDKARKQYQREILAYNQKDTLNRGYDTLLNFDPGRNFHQAEQISRRIGLFLLKQGKHAAALEIFNDLRTYFETNSNHTIEEEKQYSLTLTIIGAIYEETGLWNESLSLYMKSLQVCMTINFDEGKAKIYNNLGKLYFNRNQLTKAEGLFQKAIEINTKYNIKQELFNNYNNLGGIFQLSGKPMKALEYALIALNQLDIGKNFYDLSIIYGNIGNLYQDMKNYPVALSYYQQALHIQKKQSYSEALVNTYLSLASLCRLKSLPDSTVYYLNLAHQLAESLGNPSLKVSVLKETANYYHQTGNISNASQLFYRYFILSDSLEALNSVTRMEQIQSVYQVINEEKNSQILRQKIDLQELAIQRQRILLFAALIIFLFLGFFVFNLLRLRRREKIQNEMITRQTEELHNKEKEILLQSEHSLQIELDYQNRQLTAYALNLARTNEFIAMISDELKHIHKDMDQKDKSKTDRIRKTLSELHQFSTGNDWEQFRLYFEKVHQSFEKNLLTEFPDLTLNDIKICALIKLGLSNKDIASITFRELRSVESARNRLRKKLGIPVDLNIHTFLSKY